MMSYDRIGKWTIPEIHFKKPGLGIRPGLGVWIFSLEVPQWSS